MTMVVNSSLRKSPTLEISMISIFGTLIPMLVLSIWDRVVAECAEPILASSCNASICIAVNSMVHPFKGTPTIASLPDSSSHARFPRNRFNGILKVVRGTFLITYSFVRSIVFVKSVATGVIRFSYPVHPVAIDKHGYCPQVMREVIDR